MTTKRLTLIGPAAVAEFLQEQTDAASDQAATAAAVVYVTPDGLATYSWRIPSNRKNGAAYLALTGAVAILSQRLASEDVATEGGET